MSSTSHPSSTVALAVVLGLVGCTAKTTPVGVQSLVNQGVTVTIGPKEAQLPPLGTISFGATVTGSTNTAVTWTVTEPAGGSVGLTGFYTAPAATGIYHVVVTSQADGNRSDTATVTVSDLVPPDPNDLPVDRRTLWQPGVTHNGGIPASYVQYGPTLASTSTVSQINTAIAAAGAAAAGDGVGRYVLLGAGTFTVNSSILIQASKVILRGTLDGTGNPLTKLRGNNSDYIVDISKGEGNWSATRNLSVDAFKGDTQITLVAGGTTFSVGDLINIDQVDDTSIVFTGFVASDAQYYKRSTTGNVVGPNSPGGIRSMTQTSEVVAVSGNVLTLATPLHRDFLTTFTAQVWKSNNGAVKWSGIEDLYVTGGNNTMIHIADSAYCWVKHLEFDGSNTTDTNVATYGFSTKTGNGFGGDHFGIYRSFRCELRDSYIHDAHNGGLGIVQGGGAYGISFWVSTSDCLVENNIVKNLNKPQNCRATGGGNVFAYNYIDDGWTNADDRKMEQAMDFGHTSFPHDELYEGNWVCQIGADNVWGNSAWNVVLRNWATGIMTRMTQGYAQKSDSYEIWAVNIQSRSHHNSFLANVLGVSGQGQVYEVHSHVAGTHADGDNQWNVWGIGNGTGGGFGSYNRQGWDAYPWQATADGNPGAGNTLIRTGNWDSVGSQIDTAPNAALPNSLYLVGKPSFFGANPWPWVTPEGATKTFTLPAKARYDAATPMVVP